MQASPVQPLFGPRGSHKRNCPALMWVVRPTVRHPLISTDGRGLSVFCDLRFPLVSCSLSGSVSQTPSPLTRTPVFETELLPLRRITTQGPSQQPTSLLSQLIKPTFPWHVAFVAVPAPETPQPKLFKIKWLMLSVALCPI